MKKEECDGLLIEARWCASGRQGEMLAVAIDIFVYWLRHPTSQDVAEEKEIKEKEAL